MSTPNFILTRECKELPKGAFVRPIRREYVANDVFEHLADSRFFNDRTEVICYTGKGLKILPRDAIIPA